MSDSDNTVNDLAAQYLDLWQKQMVAQSSERVVSEAMKTANQFANQSQELLQSLDTPEKMQTWMSTWAETWKAQFEDGTNPFEQFQQQFTNAAQQNWASATAPASQHTEHDVDELTRRIAALEDRVRELESRLKD